MEKDPKKPSMGDLSIDASDLTFLVDLPPGATVGMRTRQEGYEEALHEILANQEVYGMRAGVTPHDIEQLRLAEERVALVEGRLPAARSSTA